MSGRALSRGKDPAVEDALGDEERRLEFLVRRFAAPDRRVARRLVRSSPRVGDLATVFPGALHAIATMRGGAERRDEALRLVEAGAPLKQVAAALDLPLWLRRLPPEAFRDTIPRLPSGESFARRIASRFPAHRRGAAFWLASVAFAAEAVGEEFAIWLAGQPLFNRPGDPLQCFSALAAYAWFSGQRTHPCRRLIVVPWRSEIAVDTALCAAKSWLNRLRLVVEVRAGVLTDPWCTEGSAGGYEFVPLLDADSLLCEANLMHNCADQYSHRLVQDRCRLFSVRKGGQTVASLEIGPHPREARTITVTQLKARYNAPAPLDVWQAVHAWLATQRGLRRPAPDPAAVAARHMSASLWQELLDPYRQAKGGAPWLPLEPTAASIADLDAGLTDLASRAGVTSWLFT